MEIPGTRVRLSAACVLVVAVLQVASPSSWALSTHTQGTRSPSARQCAHRTAASGTLRLGDLQFPDSLNPFQGVSSVAAEFDALLFQPLIAYDEHLRLVPIGAREIPTVRNGGLNGKEKTATIRLRPGMHWSDGSEVTSADLKFGWQVDTDRSTGPACVGPCADITRITTPDRYTAVLHLKKVVGSLIPNAIPDLWPHRWSSRAGSWNGNAGQAAHLLGQDPNFDFLGPDFPTNGPYMIAEVDKGQRIELQPMPHYSTMNCGAHIGQIIDTFYGSEAAMDSAALADQVDILPVSSLDAAQTNTLKERGFAVHTQPSLALEHIEFNLAARYNGASNPVANVRVRQALALVLDRVGLIQQAIGTDRQLAERLVAWSILLNHGTVREPFADPSIRGQWDPVVHRYVLPGSKQALHDARVLIARTPFRNGFSLSLITTAGNPVRAAQAEFIAASWARIGVRTTIEYRPNSQVYYGPFQASMFTYAGSPDPDEWKFELSSEYCASSAATAGTSIGAPQDECIHDERINEAFESGDRSFSSTVRARSYNTIQNRMNQRAYWIPLYFRPYSVAVSKRVAGYKGLWNPWSWMIKS
jgi:peptide/nickel transport system substrate-binding protein